MKDKCSYCDKSAIIHRRYSGESFCQECFIKNIEKNIYSTISKYKMVSPHNKIIVALSGGKDSIALLYNLIKIQEKKYSSKPITALSIDEGINNYREDCLKTAKKFCETQNVEHKIISFENEIGKTLDEIINVKKKSNESAYACNYCALLRRRLLNDHAKKLGGDVLAIGHNLTDVAETFMMNILYKRFQLISNQYIQKQESPQINQFFIKKIMPLMRIPEEEIVHYVNFKKLSYYPYHCPYREKEPIVRKRVLNFIEECKKFSPEIEFNLFNGFLELSQTLYIHNEKGTTNFCNICGYPSGNMEICSYCQFLEKLKN
jgi:uncharacterized protein (TIGR00269 family)